jgi:hypothetical protein
MMDRLKAIPKDLGKEIKDLQIIIGCSKETIVIVPLIAVVLMLSTSIIQITHAQNQTLSCTGVESCYEQGYAQGKANPGTSCTEAQKEIQTDNYINYCACYSDGSGLTAATPSTGTNTGTNWMDLCTKISFALTSSCDTLVNPDNTLTPQGRHVRDCIQGGALLAGAALLLGTPPTTIVSVLPTIAQLGGCGDVVDFSKLSVGQLQGLGSIFR